MAGVSGDPPALTALRSLVFNLAFFGWSALVVVFSLPLAAFPGRLMTRIARFWARSALWLLGRIAGLRHEVRGVENLPTGPAIVASKHQSAWDTLVFMTCLPDPAYVLKRELLAIPFFGWYLRKVGMIPVDRRGGARAAKFLVTDARRRIAEGRSIVIFPEGTRTAPGERRTYQAGVFALYRSLGVPVVPVALNSGLFWGRRSFFKRPGLITLEILPAIEPGIERRRFVDELARRIEEASRRLLEEASTDETNGGGRSGEG